MNKELFDKIYGMVLESDPDCIKMSSRVDAEIAHAVESYAGTMDEDGLEELSDRFVDVLSVGMNEAYRIGARHCLKLIFETLAD